MGLEGRSKVLTKTGNRQQRAKDGKLTRGHIRQLGQRLFGQSSQVDGNGCCSILVRSSRESGHGAGI